MSSIPSYVVHPGVKRRIFDRASAPKKKLKLDDRILAANSIGTIIVLGISVHGFYMGRPEFIDISIVYALINFIGSVAVLKLFDKGTLGDK